MGCEGEKLELSKKAFKYLEVWTAKEFVNVLHRAFQLPFATRQTVTCAKGFGSVKTLSS